MKEDFIRCEATTAFLLFIAGLPMLPKPKPAIKIVPWRINHVSTVFITKGAAYLVIHADLANNTSELSQYIDCFIDQVLKSEKRDKKYYKYLNILMFVARWKGREDNGQWRNLTELPISEIIRNERMFVNKMQFYNSISTHVSRAVKSAVTSSSSEIWARMQVGTNDRNWRDTIKQR